MRAKTMGVCLPTELPTKMQKQTHHKKNINNKQTSKHDITKWEDSSNDIMVCIRKKNYMWQFTNRHHMNCCF